MADAEELAEELEALRSIYFDEQDQLVITPPEIHVQVIVPFHLCPHPNHSIIAVRTSVHRAAAVRTSVHRAVCRYTTVPN